MTAAADRHLLHAAIAFAGAVVALLLPGVPAAQARDVNVRSFDGVTIRAHFYPASSRAVDERVPTVLIGPGYPTLGDTNPDGDTSDQIGQRTLRAAGYNTLTWDPRGIGGSGGIVNFNSPDFEARDVQALIDFVATAPEALLDAPNDPRVGMSGSSYGGAIQLATAAIDGRLDAIVPDVTWHNLGTAFFPEGAMKTFFAVSICGGGPAASGIPGNLLGPAAALLDRAAPPIKTACLESLGGSVNPPSRQFFIDRTPPGLRERVNTPTLITQGTVDTFFGLSEGVANYRVLRERGVPVKMLWHCGGHGRCTTSTGEEGHLRRAGLTWLNRYLKGDTSVDTGAGFEWLADDGVWRSGAGYPLPSAGTIEASGSNFKSLGVSVVDSTSSGSDGIAATPAPNAVTVGFSAPPTGSDIVGAPRLKVTYKGSAVAPNTFLYAQIVDGRANRVIGSQVTPLPVTLDDSVRTVERSLQPIAAHAGANERYRVQITPGTGVFGPQLSVGGVVLQKVEASLPLVAAGGAGTRTPRALALRVSSRRVGARARVTITTRLRTRPCSGSVTFTVTAAGRRTRSTARVPGSCNIRKVVSVSVRRGTRIRVGARFNGNRELRARSAKTVSHRVR
jgi:ABC-2 type transport system ATP-binding protein